MFLNPFTATACTISGLKNATTHLQTIFSGHTAHLLSMLCILMKILSHASAKKEDKNDQGFQIWHFYWSFSSDIMAVKGLIPSLPGCHLKTTNNRIKFETRKLFSLFSRWHVKQFLSKRTALKVDVL